MCHAGCPLSQMWAQRFGCVTTRQLSAGWALCSKLHDCLRCPQSARMHRAHPQLHPALNNDKRRADPAVTGPLAACSAPIDFPAQALWGAGSLLDVRAVPGTTGLIPGQGLAAPLQKKQVCGHCGLVSVQGLGVQAAAGGAWVPCPGLCCVWSSSRAGEQCRVRFSFPHPRSAHLAASPSPRQLPCPHLALGRTDEGDVSSRLHTLDPLLLHGHCDGFAGGLCTDGET